MIDNRHANHTSNFVATIILTKEHVVFLTVKMFSCEKYFEQSLVNTTLNTKILSCDDMYATCDVVGLTGEVKISVFHAVPWKPQR